METIFDILHDDAFTSYNAKKSFQCYFKSTGCLQISGSDPNKSQPQPFSTEVLCMVAPTIIQELDKIYKDMVRLLQTGKYSGLTPLYQSFDMGHFTDRYQIFFGSESDLVQTLMDLYTYACRWHSKILNGYYPILMFGGYRKDLIPPLNSYIANNGGAYFRFEWSTDPVFKFPLTLHISHNTILSNDLIDQIIAASHPTSIQSPDDSTSNSPT